MATLSTAERNALPDSAFACIQGSDRLYPHHHADGSIDLAHLRAALSRIGDPSNEQCGKAHLEAHAKAEGVGQENKSMNMPLDLAVKRAGEDTIEGWAMPFGMDIDGESFTPQTNFCYEWFGKSGRPFLYDHGMDSGMKVERIGMQTDYETRAEGIWAEVQLDRNRRYRKAVDRLIEEGAIGFSSGTMQHLATKNRRGEIGLWPWVELSGTPIPAHPGALGIHYVKSSDFLARLEGDVPAPLKAALAALDEWADSRDDDTPPAGVKFAEHADRLLDDVTAFRDRALGISEMRGKAGRVLSASTRERLAAHPAALRQLADDLDELLSSADAGKSALLRTLLDVEVARARKLGVPI